MFATIKVSETSFIACSLPIDFPTLVHAAYQRRTMSCKGDILVAVLSRVDRKASASRAASFSVSSWQSMCWMISLCHTPSASKSASPWSSPPLHRLVGPDRLVRPYVLPYVRGGGGVKPAARGVGEGDEGRGQEG